MAQWKVFFDKVALRTDLLIWLGVVAVCFVTKGAAVGVLLIPMLLSMNNRRQDIMLVLLTILVGLPMSNHTLVPKSMAFNMEVKILWIFVSCVLAVRVFGRRQSPLVTPLLGVLLYSGFMVLPSICGWNPMISLLKLFLFVATFLAFYEVANIVILGPRASVVQIRSAFLAFAIYIVVGSVLLIPFPSISQMRYEDLQNALQAGRAVTSLYCGMMFHSQALGPVVALMFVMVLADYLFSIRKKNWLYLALIFLSPLLVFKTSSRTALGTMLAGTTFVLYLFMLTRQVESRWKARVMMVAVGMGVLASIGVIAMPQMRETAAKFVLKTQSVEDLKGVNSEDLLSSRQGLMNVALYNFRKSPVIGNGFQVSEEYAGRRITNIKQMLSAPIEKGVWVTAVLEEGGTIGFVLFVGFFITALVKMTNRKAYTGAAVLFTHVVSNLGEFSMFAMSGVGGYAWAMVFMGVVLDAQRLREQKIIFWAMLPNEQETYEEASMRMYGIREPIYVLPSSQR